jgi:hypothetical protein
VRPDVGCGAGDHAATLLKVRRPRISDEFITVDEKGLGKVMGKNCSTPIGRFRRVFQQSIGPPPNLAETTDVREESKYVLHVHGRRMSYGPAIPLLP